MALGTVTVKPQITWDGTIGFQFGHSYDRCPFFDPPRVKHCDPPMMASRASRCGCGTHCKTRNKLTLHREHSISRIVTSYKQHSRRCRWNRWERDVPNGRMYFVPCNQCALGAVDPLLFSKSSNWTASRAIGIWHRQPAPQSIGRMTKDCMHREGGWPAGPIMAFDGRPAPSETESAGSR
jgi:hypothetical protein